jgi:hypothetical protein
VGVGPGQKDKGKRHERCAPSGVVSLKNVQHRGQQQVGELSWSNLESNLDGDDRQHEQRRQLPRLVGSQPDREQHHTEREEREGGVEQDHAGYARDALDEGDANLVAPTGVDVLVVVDRIREVVGPGPARAVENLLAGAQMKSDVRASHGADGKRQQQ